MFGDDIGEDPAAHKELGGQAHEARFGGFDQIVKNAIGHCLMEAALVAERPDVKLEALEFDAGFFRNIVENQRGEVRLAGLRAQAGEFRDLHVDLEVALRRRVGESFEGLGGLGGHQWSGFKRIGLAKCYYKRRMQPVRRHAMLPGTPIHAATQAAFH